MAFSDFSFKKIKFKQMQCHAICLLLILVVLSDAARVRHHSTGKQAMKFLRGIGVSRKTGNGSGGLWPSVFNVATKAEITTNATCGHTGRQEFCRMGEGGKGRCGVCDGFSPDPGKRHPITNAIDDGPNKWWQSPALHYGNEYSYVTITLDLKQVYQVAYVIIKVGNSPRPGSWILERSIDDGSYEPWQYFATSDKDCQDRYGIPARKGKPHYFTDSEVICTSFYSKLMPMENGEIHTFLIHGRPGANETSPELLEFTKARYVRLRLQGLRGSVEPLPVWLSQDHFRNKRLYYSIRDISIGGQCVCNGHASSCRHNVASGHPECECSHHTCGSNCDRCCPMFNQRQWGPGTSRDAKLCMPCNCHGHATSCHYDEEVDRAAISLDANGHFQGGGVCDNCTDHTTGINCERCVPGYYRPKGVSAEDREPCTKCDECTALGSTGNCELSKNNVDHDKGVVVCECRPGYVGLRCDTCADGFRGYPDCEPCPCDPRGVLVDTDCDGDCSCKGNVDGKFCDHCKAGHFALQMNNPEGCSSCYCSGVTTVCASAQLPIKRIWSTNGWLISDISVSEVEEPTLDEHDMISVGNYEIPGIEAYYWLAPEEYLGNKLEAYGGELVFKVHWVVMRGDTSGKPTTGPNVILVGRNGMRIACGDEPYTDGDMTFRITLAEFEDTWYHVPADVKDIVTRLRRTEYKGDFVTRAQFLSVLTDVKYLMLRAKFHTDQIEGSLEEAYISVGDYKDGYAPVEECSCPSGYTGLSCESCQYGHVRIISNTSSHQQIGFCAKCDCNGHSSSCNLDTGECYCEHNTMGETCERCAPGFYGNPLQGTPKDCKKCACPLEEISNNFSPSCQLDLLTLSNDDDEPGYVCTQCPKGYTGDHCEICDDGYFGLPSKLGGRCDPCTCGGGPCDRITGQCLGCRGNTEGWRCERCKLGYYGDPVIGCEACLCDPQGSISPNCNNVTGECECKEHFIGRTCNKCETGYGNVTAQCTECTCDPIGSKSNICDPHSGLCDCQPGVEGFRCDACQHLHYGFSPDGCQSCQCNPQGSLMPTCDIRTGQCRCKNFYKGKKCDNCQDGYWNSSKGCVKCDCDREGSRNKNCNQNNGHCFCKPGVLSPKCEDCKPNHYGFSNFGCKACDVCNKKGHICHPENGRCVCPPYSHGESCHICNTNTWGHEPGKGCKKCDCSTTGSVRQQCNVLTGECLCQTGYTGEKCNKCDHGYYGYPKCRRCSCDLRGTDTNSGICNAEGLCQCNPDGSCPCKPNVGGKLCNRCNNGTFGLHEENPDGCTKCFCFGRHSSCEEARFTWKKIRGENRTLTVDFTGSVRTKRSKYFSNDIVDLNSFEELPLEPANLTKIYDRYENPIYWRLPVKFNGDKILSYGGYLRFVSETVDAAEADVFASYPLVRIEGNGFKIINNQLTNPANGNYEIRLHESLWKRIHSENTVVTRKILMLTLQNVTGIFIKATDFASFHKLNLSLLSLDIAVDVPGRPPPLALGIEKCVCDPKYSGTSCQNPNISYYRKKPANPDHQTINIDAIIGISVPCICNNRSAICDSETGYCLHCLKNTAGKACDVCSEGFYGNPMSPNGECKPCACPSIKQNFAKSCTPKSRNKFSCECKDGYTGPMCNSCKSEFYGEPNVEGGICKPCDCNREGSLHNICNAITGQCHCKKGITGLKCSQCEESRHILENNKCTQCDDCIQILLDNIDDMSNDLMASTVYLRNGTLQPPWESLHNTQKRYINLEDLLEEYDANREQITSFIKKDEVNDLEREIASLEKNVDEHSDSLSDVKIKVTRNYETATKLAKDIKETRRELNDVITSLKSFGKNKIDLDAALEKGNKLLKDIEKKQKIISGYAKKSDSTSKLCKKVNDIAKHLLSRKFPDPTELRWKINDLNMRLSDMERIINDIREKNDLTTMKTMQNEEDYNHISELLMEMTRDYKVVTKRIEENNEQVKATHEILNKLQENYDIFTEHFDELYDLNKRLEKREDELDKTINNLTDYRNQISKHVDSLKRNITEYNTLFNFTTKEMDALAASKGFKIIMQTLKDANRTVHEARAEFEDILKNSLVPDGTDSIYVNTSIANANSERLVKRVENRKKQITEARMKLHRQIPDIEGNNWRNGINNNELSEKVRQMLRNNKSKINIEDIIEEANSHSINMRNIYKEAMNINVTMQHDLLKKYEKCKNLTSPENTKKIEEDMHLVKILGINATAAQKNIMSLERQMTEVKQQNEENFNRDRSKLEERLAKLRNTILKTEQIASTIFVAISGDDCSRSYKLIDLEPSVQTDVKVLFVKDDFIGDLFTIKNQDQYINLKVDEAQAHLHWKFGKTEHQLVANINNADNEILIHRMGSSMHMSVNGKKQMNMSDDSSDIFDLNPNNLLRIGMDYNNKVTGIPGCLKELSVNGRKVGFWNFVKTQGNCAACQKNNTVIIGNIKYRYNGNGYAMTVPRDASPTKINIIFKIWTFDEDALLFVAYHDESYIKISLQKGRIAFEMHYKNSTLKPLIVITKEKYNNGKQTQIKFNKVYDNKTDFLNCAVIGEQKEILNNTRMEVRSKDLFRYKKANMTFGGISPDCSFLPQFAHIPPFLGILGEVAFAGSVFDLQEKANYGIELQSDDRIKFSQILFHEGNYVKLKTAANSINNFSFVLRTEVMDGFVMNLDIDGEVVLQFTTENGKLVVSQTGSPSKLQTNDPINDDKYHLIQYIKQKSNSKLVLDGVQQMKAKTQHSQTGSEIILNIGGLENKPNKFEGLVRDVFLNGKLITVDAETYVNSDGAKIGRTIPQKLVEQEETEEESGMENATMEDMQQIDGCEKISYSLEPNAIKFGDAPNSFVRKMLKDSFWKREFKIEFEFRTFYKNGLLILAQGPNDYNLLEIKNGKVEFRMHGKRKKQLSSTLKIDDGNWHHVVIQYAAKTMKNKRKFMELEVDGVMQKVKAPPSRVTGSLYFGDTDDRRMLDKLQPFRGCLRSLKINNVPQSLINDKTTAHHNIGQCFPNIEKGSYFRGDSYALYKRSFGLSNSLEFSFNFRTTEQNGVLVSISNIGNSPALSIELQNGAIVMSVDMGSRSVTNVTNNLPKFTICNNKWHHVAAKLSTELTVIVDGVEKSWVLSDMGLSEQIEAPLYIGGLPDSAPDGTLKIRENFKGCINNLTIGSDVVDWIDMEELNNVSLNSCPVILQ